MIRWKLFLNYSEEENWLMAMKERGFKLKKRGLFYHFAKSEPKSDVIRIDYRKFSNKAAYSDYIALFEDAGWNLLAGTHKSGEQYFVKSGVDDENNSLFSDRVSAALRYRKRAVYYFNLACIVLFLVILSRMFGTFDATNIINPKEFFYTPNLWEKTGSDFRSSFLFELIVVIIFRLGPALLMFFTILFSFIYAVWSFKIYRHEQKSA
ncbi:DUF2812 domain-containing protein [Paenibacillaceae bacterium]|nr:DUF2812 domain-containing protein [Paenibacillaceae bacterium]